MVEVDRRAASLKLAGTELIRIYAAYEQHCAQTGVVDFGELLLRMHEPAKALAAAYGIPVTRQQAAATEEAAVAVEYLPAPHSTHVVAEEAPEADE